MKNLLLGAVAALFVGVAASFAQEQAPQKPVVEFFFSPSCHICHRIRTEVIDPAQNASGSRVDFLFRDISVIGDYKLFLGLIDEHRLPGSTTVPVVAVGRTVLVGETQITASFRALLARELKQATGAQQARPVDPLRHFFSFTPAAIIGAGLIDGINPCAFTVIVFFVSFLALQGYRKRQLVAIGSAFILAVFLTYVLLGVGLFAFLYQAQGFWVARRIATAGIGILSVALGFAATADLIRYLRTQDTSSMSLQLPQSVKLRIQRIIASQHRKPGGAAAAAKAVGLGASAFVTGVLVSLLEAICTGQVYLPTIGFVLRSAPAKASALGYLLLYNAMFILPLVAVFAASLFGATSADFARFMKRHFPAVKALMAALFFGLGAFLIWRG